MQRVLVITVGGSHQPVLTSLRANRPDFVYFLCSDDSDRSQGSYLQVEGEGRVLRSDPNSEKPDLPNLATLAELGPDQFRICRIEHLDELDPCYATAIQVIEEAHSRWPAAIVTADYTGGTKSMTAGLVAAALDDGRCEIALVAGSRRDLRQVVDGTQFARRLSVWDAQVSRRERVAREVVARFDYAAAARVLEEAAQRFAAPRSVARLQRSITLCRAFDAWDRFDHTRAQSLLLTCRDAFPEHKAFIAALTGSSGHGFEAVEDLVLNAERRAHQERFDDAAARLYRALELLAQVWLLKQHGIDTSSVKADSIPVGMKARLDRQRRDDGRCVVGLRDAWELVAASGDNPLSDLYRDQRGRVVGFLEVRNQSILGHGTRPVSADDQAKHASCIGGFITEGIKRALVAWQYKRHPQPPQLPRTFD